MNRRKFSAGLAALSASGLAQSRNAFASHPKVSASAISQTTDVKPVDELVDRKTKQAIEKGLEFLKRKQIRSGKNKGAFGNTGYPSGVAVSSLAGIAFMCSGSTPFSGPYSKNIANCNEFVLNNVRDTGYIARKDGTGFSNMYGHGYAMLFLSQVCGMLPNDATIKKLRKAIKMTCDIQNDQGGWRYKPVKADADLSITICQIMAMRAARDAGIQVSDEVRKKCIEYVKKSQRSDGSFQYTLRGGRTSVALTAAGVVSLYSAGIYEGPNIEKALKWIMARKPGKTSSSSVSPMNYYYAHYYAVQAMWHAQFKHPDYWNEWYVAIRDELVNRKRSGSTWPDSRVGEEFGTAMACIILQMPYNFLPIFSP